MPKPRVTILNAAEGGTSYSSTSHPLNGVPGVYGKYSATAWTLALQLTSLRLSDALLQYCESRTTPQPHELWSYWQDDDTLPSGGRLVLPDGASQATIVYSTRKVSPQCVSIVVLPDETVQEAGIAWIAEISAATGCPHRLIYVGQDDEAAADARARALFSGV
jgi:hypothetical protein